MIRLIGAALLMAGCGGFACYLAAAHRREADMLKRLIRALQEMEWELKYRLTELPELCLIAGETAGGTLKEIFKALANRLDHRDVTYISGCMNGILNQKDLPITVRRNMKQLGLSLGKFDLEGQLQGLEIVRLQCKKDLKDLDQTHVDRLKSYQSLVLCAGAALAILFL